MLHRIGFGINIATHNANTFIHSLNLTTMERKELRIWITLFGLLLLFGIPACGILTEKWDAEQKRRHPVKIATASMQHFRRSPVEQYVERFAKVAQVEQKKYGIPASITLAQGILESAAGKSTLAAEHNNHFGIKCWCRHHKDCVPFADDAPSDRFKRYSSAWESFRHHSIFVTKMRIKVTKGANYKQWAVALKKAGYATKKTYAEDLIGIVQRYNLHQYDNI